MKVLVCDPINKEAINHLKKNGIEVDNCPDIDSATLLKEVQNYEVLIVRGRTKVTKKVIQAGQKLKIIGRVGAGTDNIDKKAAAAKKIVILNAPGANAQAVAEFTIGLILALLRKINLADSSMRRGEWKKKELRGTELNSKILGIIGFGNIGQRVADLAKAFGAQIRHHDKEDTDDNLTDLLKTSDIISLNMNLNENTKNFMNKQRISQMKKTAYLINCARAEIVEEEALFNTLKSGSLAGAALDVHWTEPVPPQSDWTKLNNVILTPHIAGQTHEASLKASMIIAQDLIKFKDNL